MYDRALLHMFYTGITYIDPTESLQFNIISVTITLRSRKVGKGDRASIHSL